MLDTITQRLDLYGNLLFLVLDALALLALRAPPWGRARLGMVAVGWLAAAFIGGTAVALLSGRGSFAVMRLMCWPLFLHGPVILLWLGGRARGAAGAGLALVGAAGLAVSADAFLIEPRWLEVSRVPVAGLPVRVGLVADLQTDSVGEWEAQAFARLRDEAPDLILFAGDYLQLRGGDPAAERAELQALLRTLTPRLGSFAVRGDVDWADWEEIFAGTGVITSEATARTELPGITLTALSIGDSRAPAQSRALDIPPSDQFHIVLGHAPDFSLSASVVEAADLLLAGHTHGGQVRLPLIGPLLTLSRVPRAWAAGVTPLAGATLVVSRGIGMERGDAPRLRFGCRPELVILEPG